MMSCQREKQLLNASQQYQIHFHKKSYVESFIQKVLCRKYFYKNAVFRVRTMMVLEKWPTFSSLRTIIYGYARV